MNAEITEEYQSLANKYQSVANQKKKQLKLISLARFVCFAGIFPAFYYLSPINDILAFSISLFLLGFFLFLVRKYIQTRNKLNYYERLTEINQHEIGAIHRDFSPFDPGAEFIDPAHDYSYDLDLYGKGSLFQFVNRTVTTRGKNFLALLLNSTRKTIAGIENKQTAVEELALKLKWRQHFMTLGKEISDDKLQTWIDDPLKNCIHIKHPGVVKYLPLIFPIVILVFSGLYISDIVTEQIFIIAFLLQSIIYAIYSKTTARFYEQFQNQAKVLSRYSEMLKQIEDLPIQSVYLIELKGKLNKKNKSASSITAELKQILNEFDFRKNLIVAIFLNLIFLWDLRCVSKLYQWQQNYIGNLPIWFGVIAEIDALNSLANYNYNHQKWIIPKISSSKFHFSAEGLGHPLIEENRCVKNSFQITNEEQIAIITGANMAGKSTFLRAIGINLVLASNGCRVCASAFEFSPIRVYTNMRTSDNLMNDESYFYAELLRLQTMLNLIRKGEQLFVIVDEMLKGTNSTDKLNGSKQLIHQLISLKTHGIVATHDLGLTDLANLYPEFIKNQCFEVKLQQDELSFDYKLSDGVTRTMNATFLMKKMGIIPKTDELNN